MCMYVDINIYVYTSFVFPVFMSYLFVYIYRFSVMYNNLGVAIDNWVRTYVFGLGTDCCKNSQICTNEFKNINTQGWRGIGVCATENRYSCQDESIYMRVEIWM